MAGLPRHSYAAQVMRILCTYLRHIRADDAIMTVG